MTHTPSTTPGKYLDFFTEAGFRHLFGPPHAHLLADFLSCLLPDLRAPITDLHHLPGPSPDVGQPPGVSIIELDCVASDGSRFGVELHSTAHPYVINRSVFKTMSVYQETAGEAFDRGTRPPQVYTVALLNFNLEVSEAVVPVINMQLRNIDTGALFGDDIAIVIVQFPRFGKDLRDLVTRQDHWLYLLKHLKNLTALPDVLAKGFDDPVFREFLAVAEVDG